MGVGATGGQETGGWSGGVIPPGVASAAPAFPGHVLTRPRQWLVLSEGKRGVAGRGSGCRGRGGRARGERVLGAAGRDVPRARHGPPGPRWRPPGCEGQPAAWGQTLEARRCHPHGRKEEAEASGQLQSLPAPGRWARAWLSRALHSALQGPRCRQRAVPGPPEPQRALQKPGARRDGPCTRWVLATPSSPAAPHPNTHTQRPPPGRTPWPSSLGKGHQAPACLLAEDVFRIESSHLGAVSMSFARQRLKKIGH